MNNVYIPKRAMAIFAHPDDIEFSCTGTVARWIKNGTEVSYVILTSGDAGIDDPDISRQEAVKIREEESLQAAEITGVKDVVFLGEPDGMLEATLAMRKRLVREIRRFKPEVVICGDPTVTLASEQYINHPDHRAAATAAIDASFPAAGQPTLFSDIEKEFGFTAHKVRKVYISAWSGADTFVNIEDTIGTKIEALRAHKSQMKGWDPESMVKEWAKDTAKGKEMGYAEGFKVITLVTDEDWDVCDGDPIKLFYHKREQHKENEKTG